MGGQVRGYSSFGELGVADKRVAAAYAAVTAGLDGGEVAAVPVHVVRVGVIYKVSFDLVTQGGEEWRC